MRGLLLLTPIVSCVLALLFYLFGAGFWTVIAAFLLGGPAVTVVLALMLGGQRDEDSDRPD